MAKTSRCCGSAFRHGLAPLERGGARLQRENKADDDGAFLQLRDWVNPAGLLPDAVGDRLCHRTRTADCGTAVRPSPDLVLPSGRAIDEELRNEQGPSSDMMLADQRQGPIQ
jgi:hypothetical protein